MADKLTKRQVFEATIDVLESLDGEFEVEPLVAGLKHEVELLVRKRESSKGQDAKRKAEQDAIKAKIAAVMADRETPMRAGEIATALADGTAVQRVSALVKQMVDAGEVAREQDKKVVTFTLV